MSASSLSTDLHRIAEVQVRLPSPVVVVIALFAVGAALLPDLWMVTKHVTVLAHEGAHAIVGSSLGRTVDGIRIKPNAEGDTAISVGGRAGETAIGLAGYFGPSSFGIGAAELIRIGHVIAVLWLGLIALIILICLIRWSFGVLTVVGGFVLLFGFIHYATVGTQVVAGYGLAWFLLVSGVKRVWEVRLGSGDSNDLRRLTRIPHGFWHPLWLIGSLVALGFGASMLV